MNRYPECWNATKTGPYHDGMTLRPGQTVILTRSAGQQRGWSKALVRHGADARVALADVLGVPAKDIRSRDLRE